MLAAGAGSALPAHAALTLGMTGSPSACTLGSYLYVQTAPPPSVTYASPGAGTITAWSHEANGSVGQTVGLIVLRKASGPLAYTQVAHDGPRALTPNAPNTVPVSIPVQQGDVIGLDSGNVGATGPHGCFIATPSVGFDFAYHIGALSDGESDDFIQSNTGVINVSASVEPSNSVALGSLARNKKQGTATLTATLPWPGELTSSGSGVVTSSATAPTPGDVQLPIVATGKAKKKLKKKGKVPLGLTLTFAPSSGSAGVQQTKVVLKKKKKKKRKRKK